MARAGGERGNWLREGKTQSATHAIEKTPQFRASLERFAERAGERLSAAFGALFTAGLERTRNSNACGALAEHEGQPACLIYSEALDARFAILFEGGWFVAVLPVYWISTRFHSLPDVGVPDTVPEPQAIERWLYLKSM